MKSAWSQNHDQRDFLIVMTPNRSCNAPSSSSILHAPANSRVSCPTLGSSTTRVLVAENSNANNASCSQVWLADRHETERGETRCGTETVISSSKIWPTTILLHRQKIQHMWTPSSTTCARNLPSRGRRYGLGFNHEEMTCREKRRFLRASVPVHHHAKIGPRAPCRSVRSEYS